VSRVNGEFFVTRHGLIRRLFSEHPSSVGETYFEHARHALRFGWAMLRGSMACFVHAAFPWVHQRTGSQTILRLHGQIGINRRRQRADEMTPPDPLDSIAEDI
jgi:Family of unknown function (DUF6356)